MAKQSEGEPREAPAGSPPAEGTPPEGAAMIVPPDSGFPAEGVGGVQQEGGRPEESATAETFDSELLRQAAEYGLTTEEVRRFSDNATLGAAMSVLDRRIAGLVQRKQVDAPVAGRERPPQPLAPLPREGGDGRGEPEPIDLDFDPDLVDPKVAKALRALHDRIGTTPEREKRIRQMEQVLIGMVQRDRNRYVQDFDRALEKVGTEYEGLFGSGPTATLARRGMEVELQNRLRLDRMMGSISQGLEGLGNPTPDVAPLMRRAAAVEWGDRTAARVRGEIRASMEERAGQTIARSAGQPAATGDPDNPMMFMRREFDKAGKQVQQSSS